jgi:uncharacterized protein YjiS (DUF1127 family)
MMNSHDCTHTIAPRGQSVLALLLALAWLAVRRFSHGAVRVAEVALTWLERSRQRRQLAELSDYMLRDIGVTRVDAWAEAEKPFWRP